MAIEYKQSTRCNRKKMLDERTSPAYEPQGKTWTQFSLQIRCHHLSFDIPFNRSASGRESRAERSVRCTAVATAARGWAATRCQSTPTRRSAWNPAPTATAAAASTARRADWMVRWGRSASPGSSLSFRRPRVSSRSSGRSRRSPASSRSVAPSAAVSAVRGAATARHQTAADKRV